MNEPELPQNEKWTEIEHLPKWDEEYYDVYTAKKHGKWVMLKTLKSHYKDDPRFIAMIEKEFDVRYNLAVYSRERPRAGCIFFQDVLR